MSRIDFGWCIFENVEDLLLFVFLHAWAWAWAWVRSLYLCVRISVLVYVVLFLRLYVRRNGLAYAGSCLHTWVLTCVRETLGKSPPLPIFTYFSFVSLPCAILTHFFVILHPHISLYHSFYLHSCIKTSYFPNSSWTRNLMSTSFLQSSSPYVGRGSTNKVVEWYNLLVLEIRVYIWEVGSKPIIGLLLEKFASATLV